MREPLAGDSHQAVRVTVTSDGTPRAIAVIAGERAWLPGTHTPHNRLAVLKQGFLQHALHRCDA